MEWKEIIEMPKIKKPKKLTIISMILISVFCFFLYFIRSEKLFGYRIIVINEEINSHITNFALSILICTFMGFISLVFRKKYNVCLLIGVLLMITNILCETIFSFMNTVDIVDAVYGMVGVLFSLIYLYFINIYGFNDEQ